MDKQGKTKGQTHFVDICKVWPNCIQASIIDRGGLAALEKLKDQEFLRGRARQISKLSAEGKLSDADRFVAMASEAFFLSGMPTYCMGAAFSEALRDAKGSTSDSDVLKDEPFSAQILIPEALGFAIEHEGSKTPANGLLVYATRLGSKHRGITINAISKHSNNTFVSSCTDDGRIVWEAAASEDSFIKPIVEYALRCIAYIRSADPDLRHLRPEIPKHASERKLKAFKATNPNLFPVTWVSWDWKRPRVFGVDETSVTGHFRWQRCGKNNSQVKLIWIDEHVRHFGDKPEVISVPHTPIRLSGSEMQQ